MRQLLKIFAAVAMCTVQGLAAVDFYDFHGRDFWLPAGEKAIFDFNKITVNGQLAIRSRYPFKIDPAKTYHLKMTLSGNEYEDTVAYIGFDPCDAKGASIPAWCWQTYNDTFTQVVRRATKGTYSLWVQDASKWRKVNHSCVVAGAKKDFSDIPNKNLIAGTVSQIRQKGSIWEVVFSEPLRHTITAGTDVRQHSHGGYHYLGGANIKVPMNGTVIIDKKIKGYAPFGHYSSQQWPGNLRYAYLVILIDWTGTETSTIITEASMTVE